MANSEKKKPFAEMLRRRNVQGAVWQNVDSKGAAHYSVGVTRSYKDSDGNWKSETLYVPHEDIPRMIAVLQEADTAIYEALQQDYEAKKEAA